MTATPLFDDPSRISAFPAPIASAIELMMFELSESGEETTADETAAAIEATFCHLGRLWVAEYLHAVESDADLANEALNRSLLERTASGRHTLTGHWVGLSRRAWTHFTSREEKTVLSSLDLVDFGTLGDDDHPVARLLHFRNHFSHGSFQSTVKGIREHRQLLHDLLARLPCLRDQPAYVREVESGVVRLANRGWETVDPPPGPPLPEAHPIILGKDGSRLDLYPLLHLNHDGGALSLAPPNKAHPARLMFERAALSVWLEQYDRDRAGFLRYDGPDHPAALAAAAIDGADGRPGLRTALAASSPGLVLVEGFPGCGAEGAIAALQTEDPRGLGLDRFAAIRRVAIRPGDLGQSGLTVARVVLRLIEHALGQDVGSNPSSIKDILSPSGPLKSACSALAAANKQVLLGLEGLHHGITAYRGEPLTVRQVYEALADTAVTVVATTVPGGLERPLFDHKVVVPISDAPDAAEVQAWVARLCADRDLHGRILRALAEAKAPLHLFALCAAVETQRDDTVFEPAIERALWDLRPVLQWHREEVEIEEGARERVRLWAPFSPSLQPPESSAGGGVA